MSYNVSFSVGSSWNSGFVGSIALTNANPTALNGWTVEFDAPFEITNVWNAQIVSHVGNHYVVKNLAYNAGVAANGTVSFGFQANNTGSVPQPTGYAVNGTAIGGTPAPTPPAIAVSDVSLTEGNSGTKEAVFTVSLSKASTETVTVAYASADGTAKAGSDYIAKAGTLTFAPGETSKTVAILVQGDTAVEANETFSLNLSSPTKATLADAQGVATIVNDDTAAPAGTLSVSNVSVTEGQSGTKDALFTVSLSAAAASTVSVNYATANGTATAGSDYTAKTGTVTFAPGETTKTVAVSVIGDSLFEADETFTFNLSGASGATISKAQGVGTILNDDAAPARPTISVADISVQEGNPVFVPGTPGSGAGDGFFRTQGNQILDASGNAVKIAGVNWFGMESNRYSPDGLNVRNYKEMMTQMSDLGFNTIRLPFSDQLFEAGSRPNGIDFNKNPDLANLTGLQIMDKIVAQADALGMKIILDHHRSAAGAGANGNGLWYEGAYTEQKWIDNWKMLAARYAGNDAVIGADLHNEPHGPATWGGGGSTDWAAAAERAGNAILASNPNWLIFVEGIESYQGNYYWWGGNLMGVKDRPIQLNVGDKLVYSAHDYPNSIYGQPWFNDPAFPNNLTAKFDQMWGYIYKNNIAPVYLGEFGSRLTDPKDVAWLSKIKSYLSGDFDANGTVDIASGKEGIGWTWWSWNPNSGDTGGILADDWSTVLQNKVTQLQPLMFDFGEGGTGGSTVDGVTNAVFTVTLSAASAEAVTVAYQSVAGTADASDFTPFSGTLTFAPGETSKTVVVKVVGDARAEANETFQIALSNASGATLSKATATATILNDDGAVPTTPTNPTTPTTPTTPTGAKLQATTTVTNDWGTGYTANVAVKNTGTSAVDAWTLAFKSSSAITNIWNAEVVSSEGDTFMVHNVGWNSTISPGQEVVFGFQGVGRPSGTFEWVI
ncbi:Calx-beta domain-containing protein [Microvirga pudoricolor]|uniref:Calx-beta domain-containing protein n=1 Tax=Microvirga pudoricolor TaxID=2778729 RepID=UPI0019506E26|nr:cellulase family glycosylhydrolase [Microvirga pudoricolor]MBM6595592.1 cellulase family glycosylhydrolase [Microvirga pudoricolor]